MQGRKNYQEKLFMSFQLSDYIPEDNFYRRLKDILSLEFLCKATSKYYGQEGQKSIDPLASARVSRVRDCINNKNMSCKYKFHSKEDLYFVSFATVYWIDVFIRPLYCDILVGV